MHGIHWKGIAKVKLARRSPILSRMRPFWRQILYLGPRASAFVNCYGGARWDRAVVAAGRCRRERAILRGTATVGRVETVGRRVHALGRFGRFHVQHQHTAILAERGVLGHGGGRRVGHRVGLPPRERVLPVGLRRFPAPLAEAPHARTLQ